MTKRCYDLKGRQYDLEEVFSAYLKYGGMPGLSELPLSDDAVSHYLDSIYNTVITKDILERNESRKKVTVSDPLLLRKLTTFLADKIGRAHV